MDTEAFIRWALEDARTVEERYPVELLVELGISRWNMQRKIFQTESFEDRMERQRQRALNPAYEPHYTEQDLRRAAEMFPEFKFWHGHGGHDQRPIRDVTAFSFLTNLADLQLHNTEATDISPLAKLPRLRLLKIGSSKCENWSPLGDCIHLRELELTMHMSWWNVATLWPELSGLEKLAQLEKLALTGNLLALPRGISWPKVRTATLKCVPLAARSLKEFPQLPACEFLTLAGVEKLDGLEAFPRLRNLKIETDVRDFAPVAVLEHLTGFACGAFEPSDISPLARLPKLQRATFDTRFKSRLTAIKPRDFSPFAEAPQMRELQVLGSPPVEAEVKMLNAVFLPWDEVFLAAQPRPLPPLRLIVAPHEKFPRRLEVQLDPEDGGLPDEGLRECEGRWVGRFVARAISKKLDAPDWGSVAGDGQTRRVVVTVESFAIVEKLPQLVEALRECIAALRPDYYAMLMICLKSPSLEATPEQKELEDQFSEERDKAEWERRAREQQEYLERLHRYELKKQSGEKINPEEFVPPPAAPLPLPPWEIEDDADDHDSFSGDVMVKEKPDPPPSWLDDEHPLAGNYRLIAHITLEDFCFPPHQRDIAIYLMGREPDKEIT